MFRFIFSDEVFYHVIFQQFDIFHGMAGDKSILTNHNGEHNILVFCNAVSLYHIIIGFLIIFCKKLNPSGIAGAHGVGVVAVDVDRTGKSPVDQGQTDGQAI